ncbi:peptide ligase PGM1-related protein [Flavihumibacter fluvii]|uniref:peptide ligase PGM1-related protein n=1 Tax=Flavihumibacter fluvii TaxID=2838157 RepID=UPI001BDDE8AB|nr:peptide ligase PGM1-related protein [Flavihumibacter fluvii]ULQ52865.1 peptide ligase PGM1-related protein [Flavihumibacter fluvii]
MELYTETIKNNGPILAGESHLLPGSPGEIEQFKLLQSNFRAQFEAVFPDPFAPKTVVIIPSLSLDQEILSKINGHVFYEERMLCLLMLLRMPNTHVVFVSSVPIDPVIVDYYLHLLPGITGYHARQRLHLLSCYDSGHSALTQKILDRPRLIQRIKSAIPVGHIAHLACFNVTELERTLAVRLNLPIYGCDPDLYSWGTKSRSRQIFRECNLKLPDGFEDIKNEAGIIDALVALKSKKPQLKKAVIKIDEGFSGEGNAIFSYAGAPEGDGLREWVSNHFYDQVKVVANDMSVHTFLSKFEEMQGIVEEFLEGEIKTSPSAQYRINPVGHVDVISTHDQRLGGESGQVFLGADFPASPEYSADIGLSGKRVAEFLRDKGVLGRFAVDFLSVKENGTWQNYAIEINLRKGGTTHPFLMLQFLTDGTYNAETGVYQTANGQVRYYHSTDNLCDEKYRGLTPHDLIDIAISNDLHFDATHQEGVMFHLIGALSQFGKLGIVCIGTSPERTQGIYDDTVKALNKCQA